MPINNSKISREGIALTLLCIQINVELNPLSAIFTKWSNTLKQFVCKLPINCLIVFDHFVGLALKGLIQVTLHFKIEIEKKKLEGTISRC